MEAGGSELLGTLTALARLAGRASGADGKIAPFAGAEPSVGDEDDDTGDREDPPF
jgi:hypothetical protein